MQTFVPIQKYQINQYKEKYFRYIHHEFIKCVVDKNNDLVAFSSDVKIGDEVTANSITATTIRKNTSSPSFTIPSADGTSGQAIITDASGNLSFGDAGGE